MTLEGADKSQQCHKYFRQYSIFASDRSQVRTWGHETCFLPWAPSNLVTPPLVGYSRGGQLVFDWDRLENFLTTNDRPVGRKVTSTKCHKVQRFSFLFTFWNIDWKMLFSGILWIQCKIRRDRPSDTRRDRRVGHPWATVSMKLTPLQLPFVHHNPCCDGCERDAEKNRVRNTVAYAENFQGGVLVQGHTVVICIWCSLFVTSQFDVISMFPNQRFGEVSWYNNAYFSTSTPLISYGIALNIN